MITRILIACLALAPLTKAFDGKVADAKSCQGIENVNIYSPARQAGTVSDSLGHFHLSGFSDSDSITFSHIGYEKVTVSRRTLYENPVIYLKAVPLSLGQIVKTEKRKSWTDEEVLSRQSSFNALEFAKYGAESPAAMLAVDPAIIVSETPEGSQTLSIRGSDPEEVLIVYDGMVLNNDNTGSFDLSMLNIYDISQLQVIKGAGSALFGTGAFGGVVSIDPKLPDNEWVEASHRIDSRGSRSSAANLFLPTARNHLKLGLTRQDIVSIVFSDTSHRNVDFYSLLDRFDINPEASLILDAWYYGMNTQNSRDFRPHSNENMLGQLRFEGKLLGVNDVQLEGNIRNYREDDSYYTKFGMSDIHQDNAGNSLTAGKKFTYLNNSFQVRADRILADFKSSLDAVTPLGLMNYRDTMHKNHHAVTGIWKYSSETGSTAARWLEINSSLRYDNISYRTNKVFIQDDWPVESDSLKQFASLTHKLGISLSSQVHTLSYKVYALSGNNVRYPTFDEMYRRNYSVIYTLDKNLKPEKLNSSEIGLEASLYPDNPDLPFSSLSLNLSYYKYFYSQKIYEVSVPGYDPTPINAPSCENSGWEASLQSLNHARTLRLTAGALFLSISDIRVLQNKPENKFFFQAEYMRSDFNVRIYYFSEGQQSYASKLPSGRWVMGILDGHSNANLFVSSTLAWKKLKVDVGASCMNLLSESGDTNYLTQKKWNLQIGFHI